MTNRKKQIEEMAKIMLESMQVPDNINSAIKAAEVNKAYYSTFLNYTTHLYNAGCRIVAENSVVLTREEYELLTKDIRKKTAEKILKSIIEEIDSGFYKFSLKHTIQKLAKQFSVEIKE